MIKKKNENKKVNVIKIYLAFDEYKAGMVYTVHGVIVAIVLSKYLYIV